MTDEKIGRIDPAPHTAGRDEFLASVSNEKIHRILSVLERYDSYVWPRIFPKTKGMGAASDAKRRVRMLRSIEARLDTLLYPGEQIEFVTKGTFNSFVEQWFMGAWAFVINRTLFIFTNYRVVLINSDGKGRAKILMWQIPYDRLRKFSPGGLGRSTRFRTQSGTLYKFVGVPRRDRKLLRSYVQEQLHRVRKEAFQFPSFADRDALCSTCATPVPPRTLACSACGERFIKPRTPALMSLVIPGLGDLYLGHRGIAILEFAGFVFLLLFIVGMVSSNGAGAMPGAFVLLAVANGIDGVATHHTAKKGAMPLRLAWKSRECR